MRRIVDLQFLVVTLLLTILCLATLVKDVDGVFAWILFCASIIPVCATIYQAVLFAKAALFHSRWAPPRKDAAATSSELPGVAFLIARGLFNDARVVLPCGQATPVHCSGFLYRTALKAPQLGHLSQRSLPLPSESGTSCSVRVACSHSGHSTAAVGSS
jgi:hypothetical protein